MDNPKVIVIGMGNGVEYFRKECQSSQHIKDFVEEAVSNSNVEVVVVQKDGYTQDVPNALNRETVQTTQFSATKLREYTVDLPSQIPNIFKDGICTKKKVSRTSKRRWK